MMVYGLYPAVDNATYQFPPVIRQALAESPELHHLVIPMSEIDRNELTGAELWHGRLIFNTTSNKINYYNSQTALWYEIDLDKLSLDGGSLLGPLTLSGPPSQANHAATKAYVDTSMPIGTIVAFGGTTAPTDWHLCNGTAHGSSALQTVIGSANAPDLRDRFIVGAGSTYADKATGGAATVTLTEAQMPSHYHTNSPTTQLQGTDDLNYTSLISRGDAGLATQSVWNTSNTGGGQSHENRPPYYALTYIIKKA
jgi:microcystin-dependent protein